MKAVTRILFLDEAGDKFFGEGPCRLLRGVEETGSLRAASLSMGMAYTKALKILKNAERALGFPLTERTAGGKDGGGSRLTREGKEWLERYFAGEKPSPEDLLLRPEGTVFRQMVWRELLHIPYGQVTTYGSLAKAVARKMGRETMSAQAVGQAVGHNPISIIIPCHRVVGANGSLTGYAGGLDRKIRLLELEGAR